MKAFHWAGPLVVAACVATIVYMVYVSWKPDISPLLNFPIVSTASDAWGYGNNQFAMEGLFLG